MDKEETIRLIKGRIMDEYRKHPTLDWAEIAARKLYSQWSECFEQSRQADVSGSVCDNCGEGKPFICAKCYEIESNFRESY